jgi:hypothetical protein
MMAKRLFTPLAFVLTAFVFMLGLASITGVSAEQSDPIAADPGAAAGNVPHPAHIHSGTCAELGDVVFPLNDVAVADPNATPEASPSLALASTPVASPVDASPVASPEVGTEGTVAESSTEVAVSLDEILAAEHAINVHESAGNVGNYIACGDLTGTATDGQLTIELQELNGSGYTGEAHLQDNGDGTTTVTVYVASTGVVGTPPATPAT